MRSNVPVARKRFHHRVRRVAQRTRSIGREDAGDGSKASFGGMTFPGSK